MAVTPKSWGGPNAPIDYSPFMEGATPASPLIDLTGHAITGDNPEQIDALTYNYVTQENGVNVIRQATIRPPQDIALTFTLVFGSGGALWTPAMEAARNGGQGNRTTFAVVRKCPHDAETAHAYIRPDAIIGTPTRVADVVPHGEVGEPADWQAECRIERELIQYGIRGSKRSVAATTPLFGAAFIPPECGNTGSRAFMDALAVGGDGTAPMTVLRTKNRFATAEALAVGSAAATGSVGTGIAFRGGNAFISFASDVFGATEPADAGGILVASISDDVPNFAAVQMPAGAGPIWSISNVGDSMLVAVGGVKGGQGKVFISESGSTWEAVTGTALPSTKALLAVDGDPDRSTFYAVGEAGLAVKARISGGGFVLTPLTLPNAEAITLSSIKVLGKDHIAVGGSGGYFAESFDGGKTWEKSSTPLGSSNALVVGGDRHRLMRASGGIFATRDYITLRNTQTLQISEGATLTGKVTAIAIPNSQERQFNYFLGVTDSATGEIVVFEPSHPMA